MRSKNRSHDKGAILDVTNSAGRLLLAVENPESSQELCELSLQRLALTGAVTGFYPGRLMTRC